MSYIIRDDIRIIRDSLQEFEEKIRGKTFIVTGGAGFLGSWLCDVLNSFNAEIICVDNMSSGSESNVKHLLGRRNFNLITEDASGIEIDEEIDYVVHLACIASPPLYQKHPIETLDTNIFGTKTMLELARKNNLQGFLLSSTSEIYGDAERIPTPETYKGNVSSFGPRCMYDEGKRAAEAYCYAYYKEFHSPIRIARIFNTYGPRLDIKSTSQYGRALIKFIHQALNDKPVTVYGDGRQTRSFCYITDQVEGLIKLLMMPGLDSEIVNIGNDQEITILNLASRIISLTESKSKIVFEPLPEDDPKRRKPDISKAKRLLKWMPKIDLELGLEKTVKWASGIK